MSDRFMLWWDDVIKDFEKYSSMSCKPTFKKLPKGFITDEDKSVKWNREQVEDNNKRYEDEIVRLNIAKNSARDKLYENIYLLIQNDTGNITREDAIKMWNYAYDESHSSGFREVLSKLYDIIELVSSIVNKK